MSTALEQSRFQLDTLEERIAPSLLGGLFDSDASAHADVSAHTSLGISLGDSHVSADVSAHVSGSGSLGLGL